MNCYGLADDKLIKRYARYVEARKTADYADSQQTTDFTDYTEIINAPAHK